MSDAEINTLVKTMQGFGGHVSWRALDDGGSKPYEINIALDLMHCRAQYRVRTILGLQRFVCAHAIMLA